MVDFTHDLTGTVINIGKIVLIKIIEFVKNHPNLAIGIAIGAVIGAFAGWAVWTVIPFIGEELAKIAFFISVAVGAIAGYRMDELKKGNFVVGRDTGIIGITEDLIGIAKTFLEPLMDIFNTVFNQHILG